MSDIPHNLFEMALENTAIKTVEKYTRLVCDNCEDYIFISLEQSHKQVNDISENHWKCPKCGHSCEIDFGYAHRMLAQ